MCNTLLQEQAARFSLQQVKSGLTPRVRRLVILYFDSLWLCDLSSTTRKHYVEGISQHITKQRVVVGFANEHLMTLDISLPLLGQLQPHISMLGLKAYHLGVV